ncbi:MAG: cupin domain-containing protein [Nitrospirae bacterium]|nr:cupin domain-containing protein [Nitrospirota bacterium]
MGENEKLNKELSGGAGVSCDWSPPDTTDRLGHAEDCANKTSVVMRHRGNFEWDGTETISYKQPDTNWNNVLRRVLLGNQGEPARFHVRYFEIAPGGFTTFERHEHIHFVLVLRGSGCIKLGDTTDAVNPMDVIYVAPNMPHQLGNLSDAPFGFICVVDAERDRPVPMRVENGP